MSIKDLMNAIANKTGKVRPAKKKKKNHAETKRNRRKMSDHSKKMRRLHDSTHPVSKKR